MLRMKSTKDNDLAEIGYVQRFKLRINVNQGLDEDFTYFGSDGFSFIPYQNTLPIIGGYSEQSIYFKSLKRQLGFLSFDDEYIQREIITNTTTYENPNPYELFPGELNFEREDEYLPLLLANAETAQKACEALGFENSRFETIVSEKFPFLVFWKPGPEEWGVTTSTIQPRITDLVCWKSDMINLTVESFYKLNSTFKTSTEQLKTEFALQKMEDNYYRKNKNWELKYWKMPSDWNSSVDNRNLNTLPDDNPTLNTFVDWDTLKDETYGTKVVNIEDLFEELDGDQDRYIAHLSTTIFVKVARLITGTFRTDNDGYFYINGVEIAEADYDEPMQYTIVLKPGFNKIDIVWNEGTGGDAVELGFDITDTSFIEDGGVLNYQILPHFTLPRYLDIEGDINDPNNIVYTGELYSKLHAELGSSIGDVDITSLKYYNTTKQMWEILGMSATEDLPHPGNPQSDRYWGNIIPNNFPIFYRNGIQADIDGDLENGVGVEVDVTSEQEWYLDYYYPVLPKYGADGKFIENNYPFNNLPFPLNGPITDENENNENLIINISNQKLEENVLTDLSGNQNVGFAISDYKPNFDNETLDVKKTKRTETLKSAKQNGAF